MIGEQSSQPDEGPEQELGPEKEYNFPETAGFERFMVPLVEKLKENIETGKYDMLLSDERGGRIPTLILREIIKQKGSNRNDIETKFIVGGNDFPRKPIPVEEQALLKFLLSEGTPLDVVKSKSQAATPIESAQYEQALDYLAKMDVKDKRLLVVTQFISSGESVKKIGRALAGMKVKKFDFATAATMVSDGLGGELKDLFDAQLFIGIDGESSPLIESGHTKLSGIEKQETGYNPSPQKNPAFYEIQASGKTKMQESREDVKLAAERIIKQVWGQEK